MPTIQESLDDLVANTTTLTNTVSGRITDMDGKITQANSAQVAAENAKTNAEIAETSAQTAQTLAETARDVASGAKVDAQSAKSDALAAQSAASSAQASAEAARDASIAADVSASTNKSGAITAKNASVAAQALAETSEGNAATSASAAGNHKTKAQAWATASSDVEVETGLYSAKHYMAKAALEKTAAATSETNASGSASAASSSATSAASSASAASSSASTANTHQNTASTKAAAAATSATAAATSASAVSAYNSVFTKDTSAPAGASEGDLWYDTSLNKLKSYDGAIWRNSGGTDAQTTAPSNPSVGDLWFNTSDDSLNTWTTSSSWLDVSEQPPKFTRIENSSGATVTRSAIGKTIRVIGENFKGSTQVRIGSTTAVTTYVSDIRLDIVIPTGTAGSTYDIVIENSSGLEVTESGAFTYNRAPSFVSSGDMGTHNSGSVVTISSNASDGDGDGLTYTLTSGALPTGTTLNASTGAITGTPGASVGGTFNWTLQVTDGIESVSTSFSAVLLPTYKYREIYAHSFTGMGYKSGSPWKNVNRTDHVNDTTTNLGDRFDRSGSYLDGGWDDVSEIMYAHGAGNVNGGTHNYTSSYNMRTDAGLGGSANMSIARKDAGVSVDMTRRFGYIGGGDSSSFTKMSYTTNVGVHISNIAGPSSGAMSTAHFGEHYGWHNNGGTAIKFDFATTTATSWARAYGADACQKALSSKNGVGLIGREGTCGASDGWDEYNDSTGSYNWHGTKPYSSIGEENYSMGQDKGYCIGAFDGANQGNFSFVWNYGSRSGSSLGTAGQPKGHDGMSSGFGCSRKG